MHLVMIKSLRCTEQFALDSIVGIASPGRPSEARNPESGVRWQFTFVTKTNRPSVTEHVYIKFDVAEITLVNDIVIY